MTIISVIIPVYNASEHITETLRSVCTQVLPKDWSLEVIVVDDGSTDQSVTIVSSFPDKRIRLIESSENGGRARARNRGLNAAMGEYCLFIDADCSYVNQDVIAEYVKTFNSGVKACFGTVTAKGKGFWNRYQRDNHLSRQRSDNLLHLTTTQNFGVEKKLLLAIGGFNLEYQKYGFEDRDLYLTIRNSVNDKYLRVASNIKVNHRDNLCLDQVCGKMFESGRYSSFIFRKRYPFEYANMSYAKADFNFLNSSIRPFCRLILRSRFILKALGERAVESTFVPYKVKRLFVKTLSSLYYMAGTEKAVDR